MIVIRIHINGSCKPFGEWFIKAYGNTCIFPSSDITTPHDRGMPLLLKGFGKKIFRVAIVQGRGQHILISMGEFNICGELGLQIRISCLVGILIQEKQEWIQVTVIRTVDPPSEVQVKTVFVIQFISYICRRESIYIGLFEGGVVVIDRIYISILMTIVVGIFNAQAGLQVPFFYFFGEVDISGVYIFMVDKIVRLCGVRHISSIAYINNNLLCCRWKQNSF